MASVPPSLQPAQRGTRRRTSWSARLASVLLILAAPVATWWLVGPNPGDGLGSDPMLRPDDYDYLFHPPAIDATMERVGGWAAVAVAALGVALLVVEARHGRIDRRWWPPIVGMTLVGAIIGLAGRVMTAAVVGANIGDGFMLLFGPPVVLVLVIGSIVWSIQNLRTTTPTAH